MPTTEMQHLSPPRAMRALIVEDEPRLRALLSDVLPEMGFAATAARSAEEAARLMETDPHDVLILDLHLPGMDGMDFFECVRKEWPRTQVIVLTGFGSLEAAKRAIHLDVVEFLSKPCHLRDLEVSLDRARRKLAGSSNTTSFRPEAAVASSESIPTLADMERKQIFDALARHAGNRTAAATELGISRRTLHYRLSEYRRDGYRLPD